ncbi:hypothetical protein B0920_03400 [Massilia sp. KIM]|nr:hypothetical protein B0920_03400 [Massilia sp. KIM]
MRQVVANLVKNAIEALLDSKLDVKNRRIEIATRQLGSQEISICVKDNGLGINPCHRDRIFHSTFTTKEGNSGMGLTICRAIARAHHGDIQYSPRTSGGAIFEVRVPSQC